MHRPHCKNIEVKQGGALVRLKGKATKTLAGSGTHSQPHHLNNESESKAVRTGEQDVVPMLMPSVNTKRGHSLHASKLHTCSPMRHTA